MLPKRLRLSRDTFSKLGRSRSVSGTYVSVVFGESRAGGCAAVVSKKVAKGAMRRHLVKRRILSVVKPYCTHSRYLVVYAKMGADTVSFKELSSELTNILSNLS